MDKFLDKVGMYSSELAESIDEKEKEFYAAVLDKFFTQMYQNKVSARTLAMHFVEQISIKSKIQVPMIL